MKKSKKQAAPTEDETFKLNYMQALNEKFKLRGQLAALKNQLEDLHARAELMTYDIQDKQEAKQAQRTKPVHHQPKPKPVVVKTPSPPKVEAQAQTPPLIISHPSTQDAVTEDVLPPPPPSPPKVTTYTQDEREEVKLGVIEPVEELEEVEEEVEEEVQIVYQDELVVTKVDKPGVPTNIPHLQQEIIHLTEAFENITFYCILIVIALFGIIFAKEIHTFASRWSKHTPVPMLPLKKQDYLQPSCSCDEPIPEHAEEIFISEPAPTAIATASCDNKEVIMSAMTETKPKIKVQYKVELEDVITVPDCDYCKTEMPQKCVDPIRSSH